MIGVLVFDTLPGLFIGIAVSIVLLIFRASTPHVAELGNVPGARGHYTDLARNPDDVPVPGLVIVRPESGLFFANADHVRDEIRAAVGRSRPHAVMLDAETVPFIDVTAITMIEQLAGELEREGVQLVIARDIGGVQDVIARAQDGNMTIPAYPTVHAAVDALTTAGRNAGPRPSRTR
jgi:sulfate permease, SulP family